ncbi:hypothetical protein Palpr_2298 [Paludibacter propionicigenes WB4]|uniref:Uncharacterized protein n=1 Tax=Paludibacter propionicigenes (strain DSM 17365 / JCM 13257 / WB4) TaxID=694427 RepID=E4T6U0_PALPW|nr:hypothetical protein [Paludibacter propionicigenes]ADQ80434.1 hypothetical protein Palpr_2298 [Paludibacter propionicigenes WB4]
MSGEKFDLEIDANILAINSPQSCVNGPYKIVYKHIKERWVIIALDWDGEPRLGIRWFWDKSGNPISRGYPTWFIIPTSLSNAILNGLPLDFAFRSKIADFLASKILGNDL